MFSLCKKYLDWHNNLKDIQQFYLIANTKVPLLTALLLDSMYSDMRKPTMYFILSGFIKQFPHHPSDKPVADSCSVYYFDLKTKK